MGFARKLKRKSMLQDIRRCCGQKMSRKMGYDTETHIFYFCEHCGKERFVKRADNCEIASIVENCEDCGFCDIADVSRTVDTYEKS